MLPRSQLVLLAAVLVSALVSPLSGRINPYVLDVVIGIGINVILATSLNLINGYTGQFSLGHAGFMAVGAYGGAMLTTVYGATLLPWVGGQSWLLFPLALLTGGLLAAGVGFIVGVPSLRLRGDYLAIVTLGFGEIIRVVFTNMEQVGGARGLSGIPGHANLFWTFSLAALSTYVVWALVNSTYGRGFLAVSDDEVAAEAMGLNTTRYKIMAFVVGAFFAGIAGGLYAHFKQFIEPGGFGFIRSIEIVVIVILGGMGSTPGVILAAIVLTLLLEGLRWLSGVSIGGHSLRWLTDTKMILYSFMLIVLMIARPQGLFPSSRKAKF